jgi:hypothetical protein
MGRRRAVALVIVSVWVGWTLAMWFVATRSFRTAERVWQKPGPQFAQILKPLGESESLTVLHHFASEVNATYFRVYGLAQILLGIVLLLLLWPGKPRDTVGLVVAGVMLALVLILPVIIEPQIASLGGSIEFNPSSAQMARFWSLHGAYVGLDGVKLLAGIVLAVRWVLAA